MSKLKEWSVCPYCGSESIDIVTYSAELEYCGCRVCKVFEDKESVSWKIIKKKLEDKHVCREI